MSIPYLFDPSGSSAQNKISNEEHVVTVSNAINAYLIVPDANPYYGDSMSVVNSAGHTLQEGVDYYLSHPWQQATAATGKDVYATITLLSGYPVGIYFLNYQTIGGEYVTSPVNGIQSGLIAINSEYTEVDWSTAPTVFPPTPHTHDLNGISGIADIYQSLNAIANVLASPKSGVAYNDVEGIDTMYAVSVARPLLEMVETIGVNLQAESELFSSILDDTFYEQAIDNLPNTLQHYTIPLPGGFKIKVGQATFDLFGEPDRLTFAKPAFEHFCIYASSSISFQNPLTPLNNDRVKAGTADVAGFKILVDWDPAHTPGIRILKYFAIGK